MRVLAIGHAASRSGAPIVFRNVIRWLRAQAGWTVDVVFIEGGPVLAEIPGARLLGSGWRGGLISGRGYDVIYCNSTPSLTHLRWPTRAPVVLHAHEMRWAIEVTLGESARKLLARPTMTIVPSPAVVDALASYGVDRSSITTVPGPVETTHESFSNPADLLSEPASPPIVLASGTVEWRKGVDLFVQLASLYARRYGGARFLWLGSGSRLENLSFHWEVDKAAAPVEILPHVADPAPVLSAASVFALTSREDPFPLVVIEAALARKPIICFANAGGAADLAQQGAGVAVPYLDVDAMTDELHVLLANPPLRHQLGNRGHELVAQACTTEVGGPVIASVLRDAIGRRSS